MRNSIGAVLFPGGRVMFYEYHGTSDICNPTLRATKEDVWHYWRKDVPGKSWDDIKACTHAVPVEIYSDYGGGFYWPGKACEECGLIIEGHNPYDDDGDPRAPFKHTDGMLEWVKNVLGSER